MKDTKVKGLWNLLLSFQRATKAGQNTEVLESLLKGNRLGALKGHCMKLLRCGLGFSEVPRVLEMLEM